VDVPVHAGGGPGPVPMQPHMGGGYLPQYQGGGPNGAGQTIYHGSQAQHVYGNGPQSRIVGLPPQGGYDPNFNYGIGGYRH
jgi:hypothetical protein